MSGQGYPDEGKDKRLLPGLGWLQRASQIPFTPTLGRALFRRVWFILWHKQLPPYIMAQRFKFQNGVLRVRRISIGWCWRPNERYYMWEAAWKWQDEMEWDYLRLQNPAPTSMSAPAAHS